MRAVDSQSGWFGNLYFITRAQISSCPAFGIAQTDVLFGIACYGIAVGSGIIGNAAAMLCELCDTAPAAIVQCKNCFRRCAKGHGCLTVFHGQIISLVESGTICELSRYRGYIFRGFLILHRVGILIPGAGGIVIVFVILPGLVVSAIFIGIIL